MTGGYLSREQRGKLDIVEPRVQEDILFIVVADPAARVLFQQFLYQINGRFAVLEILWEVRRLFDDVVGHYVFRGVHER